MHVEDVRMTWSKRVPRNFWVVQRHFSFEIKIILHVYII